MCHAGDPLVPGDCNSVEALKSRSELNGEQLPGRHYATRDQDQFLAVGRPRAIEIALFREANSLKRPWSSNLREHLAVGRQFRRGARRSRRTWLRWSKLV